MVIPGMPPVRDDILELLGATCGCGGGERGAELVSPELLVDLLFDEGEVTHNQFGFTHEVRDSGSSSSSRRL